MGMICSLHKMSDPAIDLALKDPDELENVLNDDKICDAGDEPYVDLDKAWSAIHYLLSASEPYSHDLLYGGEMVGDGADGLLAHVLRSSEVEKFDDDLMTISEEEMRGRYDPQDMMRQEIYPEIWDRDDDDGLGYVMEHFKTLKEFVHASRECGRGLLICISG